jgi:hypothetical protein
MAGLKRRIQKRVMNENGSSDETLFITTLCFLLHKRLLENHITVGMDERTEYV